MIHSACFVGLQQDVSTTLRPIPLVPCAPSVTLGHCKSSAFYISSFPIFSSFLFLPLSGDNLRCTGIRWPAHRYFQHGCNRAPNPCHLPTSPRNGFSSACQHKFALIALPLPAPSAPPYLSLSPHSNSRGVLSRLFRR